MSITIDYTKPYQGEVIQLWDGTRLEIIEAKDTSPDGEGGFLLDLRVRDENGFVKTMPNMTVDAIEACMDKEVDVPTLADYCGRCDSVFGCRI